MEKIWNIGGPILLFMWLIVCTIYLIIRIRKKLNEANKGKKIIVKCEKCKNEHEATAEEFFSTFMSKTKSIKISGNAGEVGGSATYYTYMAKKFLCPKCNKKTWSEIKDYNNFAKNNMKNMLPSILIYFAIVLIGARILIGIVDGIKYIVELFI